MYKHQLETLSEETGTIVVNITQSDHNANDEGIAAGDALRFIREHISRSHDLIKVLLPATSGYVAQSDFLGRRMVDCANVSAVEDFLAPGQHLTGHKLSEYERMTTGDLLACCYGAIAIRSEGEQSIDDTSVSINNELFRRLSFPWLSKQVVEPKRFAMLGGGSLAKVSGYATAATSLNVKMIVFDEASHWMADSSYSHLREEFIPFDMTPDESMPERLAQGIEEYQKGGKQLDGIMSVDEHLLTIVAQAAALVGLNASPAASVAMAQNKFKTRQLDTNVYCRLVRSIDEFEKLMQEEGSTLEYPLIVKPARGWSSEGVWKVSNETELREKAPTLWRSEFTDWHGHDVVIETYVEGPEVDANMVLVDGKIVFFEVNDDFPSPGDYSRDEFEAKNSEDNLVANFVETSNIIPSCLPSSELKALEKRLHELVLKAGFRNGVLHMEAKLRNSSCHYAAGHEPGEEDLIDLRLKSTDNDGSEFKPGDVFLLEINPRAPGWQEVEATARAYGVSYYTLSVLHAVRDRERMTMLSQPFRDGAQYHMQLLFISARKGGIYNYGDVCATIASEHKDILTQNSFGAQIIKSYSLMENGQDVPDPKTGKVYGNFIAFFLIASRKSRKEAIRFGQVVEDLVRKHTACF